MSPNLGGQCLNAMWPSLSGQCLIATWHNLGGQCLNVMRHNLGGQCLNSRWYLINQNYVWPINQGLTCHLDDKITKSSIEPLIILLLPKHLKITTQKNWTKPPNCLFSGFFIPLRSNHYSKPLSLLEIHYSGIVAKWVVCIVV
jgi:hypothetical protein